MRSGDDRALPLFRSKALETEYLRAYDGALELWPVPCEQQDIPTRYGKTHVITAGREESPPLILLHSAQASSTMWFPNIKDLADVFRIHAVDFILETGKSIPERRMERREDLTAWLIEVLDHYELSRPDVVGISRGAWNAAALAILNPERIGKIALLSPAQTFSPITNFGFLWSTVMCSFFPSQKHIRDMARKVFRKPAHVPEPFLRQYQCALKSFNLMNGIQVPPTLFTDAELEKLIAPCLLLIGDHDVINGRESIERAKSKVPDIRIKTIEDAGHILTIDQPDRVNGELIRFFTDR